LCALVGTNKELDISKARNNHEDNLRLLRYRQALKCSRW